MVIVYSKENCGKCEDAKDKLKNYFKIDFEERKAHDYIKWNKGWKENNSVNVMACYADIETLPIIEINGECMAYNQAMKLLKGSNV